MRFERTSTIRVALGITFATLSIGGALAAGDTLRAGDPLTQGQWYGRAGGLVGSDRVMAIGKSSADKVGISYDQDVAKRTNMPREAAGKSEISITHDKDVIERTNMQRDVPPTKSAGEPAGPHN